MKNIEINLNEKEIGTFERVLDEYQRTITYDRNQVEVAKKVKDQLPTTSHD
jgi:hypothetical protein